MQGSSNAAENLGGWTNVVVASDLEGSTDKATIDYIVKYNSKLRLASVEIYSFRVKNPESFVNINSLDFEIDIGGIAEISQSIGFPITIWDGNLSGLMMFFTTEWSDKLRIIINAVSFTELSYYHQLSGAQILIPCK